MRFRPRPYTLAGPWAGGELSSRQRKDFPKYGRLAVAKALKIARSRATAEKPDEPPSRLPPTERRAIGKQLRDTVPRAAHGDWRAHAGRKDPISILRVADATRQPHLVPLRYGRTLAG
jgi:uncharacterized membrane protein